MQTPHTDLGPTAKPAAPLRYRAERLRLTGRVQGVGFRPFVYRLANQHGLTGWVQNQLGEVEIFVEGCPADLEQFRTELIASAPPLARPLIAAIREAECQLLQNFSIRDSASQREARIFVPPDNFTCPDCLAELKNASDRRYRYPFINCTQCGPRYTLINAMPYDRPNTSMAGFPLCPACAAEYHNPADRRFHAEPLACERCGPSLELVRDDETIATGNEDCLHLAVNVLYDGQILAVKGIGGYHLLCDAANSSTVAELRRRKNRPDKPFAVMFPEGDDDDPLACLRQHVTVSEDEAGALLHPARPIVLLRKQASSALAQNLAPGLAELGSFLPYSPLHHLLLDAFGGPVVATSGNVSGEPVLTDRNTAQERLGPIADVFLHHDRPIVRPADDSVMRRTGGAVRPIRIGRGMAPRELEIPVALDSPVLAVGGQMKNTIAIGWKNRVIVSPHIGEMDSPRSLLVLDTVARDLQKLYGVRAVQVLADRHPGYTTHRYAANLKLPCTWILHHHAHASALVGELGGEDSWAVFTWDGVGLGEDGTLWGGECLVGRPGNWRRFASLAPIRPPGGDAAARQPWRSAAAMLWADERDWDGIPDPHRIAYTAWQKGINCPTSSAAGRLFDGAASMVCGIEDCSFEAQAPMFFEALATPGEQMPGALPLLRHEDGIWRSDWRPMLPMLLDPHRSKQHRATNFHAVMARVIVDQARKVRDETGINRVGLTGGVFQNRILADAAMRWLRLDGFAASMPSVMPCNDAALSFGQVVEFAAGGGSQHE